MNHSAALAAAPEWLVDLTQQAPDPPKPNGHAPDAVFDEAKIVHPHRTPHLVSMAGTMNRKGMDPAAIEAALLVENITRCSPPLEVEKVRKIAHEIPLRYQAKRPSYFSEEIWRPETMREFLNAEENETAYPIPDVVAKGHITELFSPRGLGKTVLAVSFAVRLTRAGYKVFYLNRDNPRKYVRMLFLGFGVTDNTDNLHYLGRDRCPRLTEPEKWDAFPYASTTSLLSIPSTRMRREWENRTPENPRGRLLLFSTSAARRTPPPCWSSATQGRSSAVRGLRNHPSANGRPRSGCWLSLGSSDGPRRKR